MVVHSAAANMRTNTLGSEPSIKDSSRPKAALAGITVDDGFRVSFTMLYWFDSASLVHEAKRMH